MSSSCRHLESEKELYKIDVQVLVAKKLSLWQIFAFRYRCNDDEDLPLQLADKEPLFLARWHSIRVTGPLMRTH